MRLFLLGFMFTIMGLSSYHFEGFSSLLFGLMSFSYFIMFILEGLEMKVSKRETRDVTPRSQSKHWLKVNS
jgi:hypothetical protein